MQTGTVRPRSSLAPGSLTLQFLKANDHPWAHTVLTHARTYSHTHTHTEARKLFIIGTLRKHFQVNLQKDSLTGTNLYSLFIIVTLTVGNILPHSHTIILYRKVKYRHTRRRMKRSMH